MSLDRLVFFDSSNLVKLVKKFREEGFATGDQLIDFVEAAWGIRVPRRPVCPHHNAPAEYLVESFFGSSDCICWANRGGGKTLLGAITTALDAIFKVRCETKILGGSGEQSLRMYAHIKDLLGEAYTRDAWEPLVNGEVLQTKTGLINDSTIQILTASSRSVRGPHPQKLKLDEVDEFERPIYEASLLIPISKWDIPATTHIYSTMHKPYGLMQEIVQGAAGKGYKVFKWCVFDVLEKCVGRECEGCELWEDCQGRAREADGYYKIEDAISAKRKVSPTTWKAEMLCLIPSQEGLIYKEFDPTVHIQDFDLEEFLP